MRHRYWLEHSDGSRDGPFRTLAAVEKVLATRECGEITEDWKGKCEQCGEEICIGSGYFQHGCGRGYDFDATI